LHAANIAKK
jgi:hypothetical protein